MGRVVISHGSALLVWRRIHMDALACRDVPRATATWDTPPRRHAMADAVAGAARAGHVGRAEVEGILSRLGIPAPLHVLEGNPALEPRTSLAHCHKSRRPLDARLLHELDRGVLVCAPTLALRQLACALGLVDIALIAYELCGSYALAHDVDDGFVRDLAPVSSAAGLCGLVPLLPWSAQDRESRRVRTALNAVVDGSASPMESRLALMLFLPRAFGGFGLPKARLNRPIPVHGKATFYTRRQTVVPDMCWPEGHLVLEYLGGHHDDPGRAAQDSERDNALAAMGHGVIDVTKREARDLDVLSVIAEDVCRATNSRQRPASSRMLERRAELHAHLFLRADDRDLTASPR